MSPRGHASAKNGRRRKRLAVCTSIVGNDKETVSWAPGNGKEMVTKRSGSGKKMVGNGKETVSWAPGNG